MADQPSETDNGGTNARSKDKQAETEEVPVKFAPEEEAVRAHLRTTTLAMISG